MRQGAAAAANDAQALASWILDRCRAQGVASVGHREAQRLGPIRDSDRFKATISALAESGALTEFREGRRKLIALARMVSPATLATVPRMVPPSVASSRAQLLDALAVVKAAGVRMWTENGQRIVAVSPAEDSPQLRDALEALGYGGCRVLHLDTEPYRGLSSDGIAAAIEQGGGGGNHADLSVSRPCGL